MNLPKPSTRTCPSPWSSLTNGRPDSSVLLFLVGILNVPLLFGATTEPFRFSEASLSISHCWQLLSHPLVHVSWYHLLLDSTAFFALYPCLLEPKARVRLTYLGGTAVGSLLAAQWFNPEIGSIGFCGLSGVAHGMMAIWGLERLHTKLPHRWIGALSLLLVVTKVIWELSTGTPVAGLLHFDLMGTPILACHAGGVGGGIVTYGLRQARNRNLK